MESEKLNLELDLEELKELLGKAERGNVKKILEFEIEKAQKEKTEVEERVKNAKKVEADDGDNILYQMISSYSWDESEKFASIYISLKGIGAIGEDKINCGFDVTTFELKIHKYQNKNYRFSIPKLNGKLNPSKCKLRIKPDMIIVKLAKQTKGKWTDLIKKKELLKEEDIKAGGNDAQAGIFNMMKKMYQEGDDNMKKTIAEAWTKTQGKGGLPNPGM